MLEGEKGGNPPAVPVKKGNEEERRDIKNRTESAPLRWRAISLKTLIGRTTKAI